MIRSFGRYTFWKQLTKSVTSNMVENNWNENYLTKEHDRDAEVNVTDAEAKLQTATQKIREYLERLDIIRAVNIDINMLENIREVLFDKSLSLKYDSTTLDDV